MRAARPSGNPRAIPLRRVSKSSLRRLIITAAIIGLAALPPGLSAQTKRTKPKKPAVQKAKPTVTPVPSPEPTPADTSTKRNARPSGDSRPSNAAAAYQPEYFYTFDRPGFLYDHIAIEHDETGKGKITFTKSDFEEPMTDPVQLSAVTMENLKSAFAALGFLDSTEEYQVKGRDYSHMGNVAITLKKQGRERMVKYNWTDNKDAKALMDEYRRIGNEYTWRFEITLARENQPLQAPGLMDTLASYYKRNELSDPPHLIPLLTELSTDERIPLMARNRAAKLIEQIQKAKK